MPVINPETGRLRVIDVQRMHNAIGGDPVAEALIAQFTEDRYGERSFFPCQAEGCGGNFASTGGVHSRGEET